MNRKDLIAVILLIFLTILVYSQTVSFGFINWDDDIHVYKNPAFESVNPLKDIWTSFKTMSYVPVAHSVFFLQWKISQSPQLFHVTNIMLHLINILLIFILLKRLKIRLAYVFFISLIYAIHPMRVETAAWITEQKGLIAGIFIWLSFINYITYKEKRKASLLTPTAIFYVLALLSKQTAFPLFFVFLAFSYFILEEKKLKKYIPEVLTLGAIGLGIMSVHWLRESRHFTQTVAAYIPLYNRVLISSKSFIYYLLKTVLPFNFCPIYPRWEFSQDFTGDFLPVVAVILLTLGIFFYYRKTHTLFAKRLVFAYLSYAFCIFPVTGIFTMPYMNTTFIADRYSYFSGFFAVVIFVLLVGKFLKKYCYLILIPFCILCTFITYHYIPIWEEPVVFWNCVMKKNPGEASSYTNLSYYYIHKEGANTEDIMYAMSLAEKAMAVNPENSIGYYNYGTCLMKLNRLAEAEEYFRKSLVIKPDYSDIWNDLGYLLEIQGRIRDAIECYNKALEHTPDHKVARYNLERIGQRENL